MKKKQAASTSSPRAAAITLYGVYKPGLGAETAVTFEDAKQRMIRQLADTLKALEDLTLSEFRELVLREPFRAAEASQKIGDFIDPDSRVLLYAIDGRKIRGTVEAQEATGRIRGDIHRDAEGKICYDDVTVDAEDCEYDTLKDGDGNALFEAASGPHVKECDVVLVSKSRVDEFLAAVAKRAGEAVPA